MEKTIVLLFLPLLVLGSETIDSEYVPKLSSPEWNNVYTVTGSLVIPYAEIVEPFYAWYDEPNKRSRIDYYGGMVKTFQLGNVGSHGVSRKVAPITNEHELNKYKCLEVNGSSEAFIGPQSILPDLLNFKCIGEQIINGQKTEKWQLIETVGHKTNKYTMWMRYKTNQLSSVGYVPIPVRYEMKGFNSLLGSHYDHYYLDYENYDIDDISSQIFEIDEKQKPCSGFPGPGEKHIYTFNPMREFMRPHYEDHLNFEFDKFKVKHGKSYENDKEHTQRKELFRQNIRFIHSKNRAHLGFTLEVNHLTDHTDLELKALRGKQYTPGSNGGQEFPYKNNLTQVIKDMPEQLDWRIYGAVTPVKDQSVCGSCWSFGTVGAIEGAYFLKTGNLVRLSQQALIDCSWGYGNNGCDGGEDFRSYQWMLKHGGIPTEDSYGPYLGQDGFCHIDSTPLEAKITGYVNVTPNHIDSLRFAIAKNGPISVAIDASHKTFSFYSNGVYYDPKCGNGPDQLDHAVLAVGYGTIKNEPYWLIKNSWSTYWGNDGYVLMSAKDNNCGVMTAPTYVTM